MTQQWQLRSFYHTHEELVNSAKQYVRSRYRYCHGKSKNIFKASPSPPKSTRQTQASYQSQRMRGSTCMRYRNYLMLLLAHHVRNCVRNSYQIQLTPDKNVDMYTRTRCIYTKHLYQGGGEEYFHQAYVLIELCSYELKYWYRLFRRGFTLKIRNYPHLITFV